MDEYDLTSGIDGSAFQSPGTFSEDNLGDSAQDDTGWIDVASSMIAAVRYVGSEGVMYVRFLNGSEYTYSVSEQTFKDMINAPSVGS